MGSLNLNRIQDIVNVLESLLVTNKKSGSEYEVKNFNPKTQERVKRTGKLDKLRKYARQADMEVTEKMLKKFGFESQEEVANLVGIGALEPKAGEYQVLETSPPPTISVDIKATLEGGGSVKLYSEVRGKVLHNLIIKVTKGKPGDGTRIMLAEVEEAKRKGLKEIRLTAAAGNYNGYYTWGRLGYEPLDMNVVRSRLSLDVADKIHLLENKANKQKDKKKQQQILDQIERMKVLLQKTKEKKTMKEIIHDPETREFWKENGDEWEGRFVLSDANVAYLRAYAKAKGYV